MNGEILYLVNHTEDCQGYNKHSAFTSEKDAFAEYKKLVAKEKKNVNIVEVYEEREWEFYYEHNEGHARIYIEMVMVGQPVGHHVDEDGTLYPARD